jgi:hypothetical protein
VQPFRDEEDGEEVGQQESTASKRTVIIEQVYESSPGTASSWFAPPTFARPEGVAEIPAGSIGKNKPKTGISEGF